MMLSQYSKKALNITRFSKKQNRSFLTAKVWNGSQIRQRSNRLSNLTRTHAAAASGVGISYAIMAVQPFATSCEIGEIELPPAPLELTPLTQLESFWDRVRRGWRILLRILKLSMAMTPVAALYPLYRFLPKPHIDPKEDAHTAVLSTGGNDGSFAARLRSWYFRVCLRCAEHSGAAVIKLLQWAGSRPDLFGKEFCGVFSRLQDDTTPHSWKHTDRAMQAAYGENWQEKIKLTEILGSGCIGQVYRGRIRTSNQEQRDVAVKVLHPSVEDDMEADLDLLRLMAYGATILQGGPTWLDWQGMVEEFARLLNVQMDLRFEARNLVKFGENFKDWDNDIVIFPKLVKEFPPIDKHVLVESFLDGIPILDYARAHEEDRERLHTMCNRAIKAVCKMIFLDNFLHGDLHPGNVRITNDGKSIILLDVGIVTEYSDHDHKVIVDVIKAFIRRQGDVAGERMMDDSHHYKMTVRGAEQFKEKMAYLTDRATETERYFMEHLGDYIAFICRAAAEHHIRLNPAFISIALAVKVQEGIALALDPSVKIIKVAMPVILESEGKRRMQIKWNKLKTSAREWTESVLSQTKEQSPTPNSREQ